MKVIVSSKGRMLADELDPRFGRAAYFIVYEVETGEFEAIENAGVEMQGGAGTHAAQLAASKGAAAVISGSFGPNAFNTLNAAGIEMYTAGGMKILEAINALKSGGLTKAQSAGASGKH